MTLDPPAGDGEDPNGRDQVTREAPSWLVSMVIHSDPLLLILAFISTPAGTFNRNTHAQYRAEHFWTHRLILQSLRSPPPIHPER